MKHKIALVTGASRGIGKGIALALAKSGIKVALGYHQNRALAEQTVQSIQSEFGIAFAVKIQVEDRQSVKKALSEINQVFGPVNILINNAAIAQEKSFDLITDQDWDAMLAVNLRGPFICAQEVIPSMVSQKWGRIVNITSIGGQIGGLRQVHYAASKAGLISLTRSLARVYSANGITTNAIAPGLVETDMTAAELGSKEGATKVQGIPVGRIANMDEITAAALFLVSDAASYITGQTMNVNGGMYCG